MTDSDKLGTINMYLRAAVLAAIGLLSIYGCALQRDVPVQDAASGPNGADGDSASQSADDNADAAPADDAAGDAGDADAGDESDAAADPADAPAICRSRATRSRAKSSSAW